jgi:formate dehydrogenase
LHRLNDHFHHLAAPHLAALAHIMRLPMAEIWEVASFYDHFTLVKEGQTAPPARTLRVCTSLSCMMAGADELLEEARKLEGPDLRVVTAPCLGACDKAPVVADGHLLIPEQDQKDENYIDSIAAHCARPAAPATLSGYTDFDAYRGKGGYALIEALHFGAADKEALMSELGNAHLRGLGGAGFPTGRKWQIVASYPGPRLMAVNGDEGEPGTFKDRLYLSTDPHRMIEGVLIAGYLVGIDKAYLYIRDEYPEIIAMLHRELEKVTTAGLASHMALEIRRGAGAYICGEESAMIESIEGKRGLPRHRPPYVAENGLFGRPTLVNNIETLYWVRDILEQGAGWYNQQGKSDHPGFRSYSVSGRVARPGVVRAPAGSSVAELIERCGGMAEGHSFKAYLPGGASGGILPASKADIPLDFGGALADEGCFVGSHAVVVLSDKDNMWHAALNLMQFFKHESCGQCTPCRSGTEKAVTLMQSSTPDTKLLHELSEVMTDASICGLGQAASNPLLSVMKHFPEDIPNNTTGTSRPGKFK